MMRWLRRPLGIGVVTGSTYGLLIRVAAEVKAISAVFWGMSLSFLFVAPFAMGILTVRSHPAPSIVYRIFAPWVSVLVATAAAMVLGLEGSICVLMGLPLILAASSLGGLAATAVRGHERASMTAVVGLPLALGAIEGRLEARTQVHRVETATTVQASPSRVWEEIASVQEISRSELAPALYLKLGFPRPLSAVIDRPGVGAIREARFEGGLWFRETVTAWEPGRRLAFSISAQTDAVAPSTLDPHVMVGGPYFDVLRGIYSLEPAANGATTLRLVSELRVSTHFNWYATFWADRIMRSIQVTIVDVERRRAERPQATVSTKL